MVQNSLIGDHINYYKLSIEEITNKLNSDTEKGLTSDYVNEKQKEFAPNFLNTKQTKTLRTCLTFQPLECNS